jgi:uncharacterized membrane protein YadS
MVRAFLTLNASIASLSKGEVAIFVGQTLEVVEGIFGAGRPIIESGDLAELGHGSLCRVVPPH